MPGMDSHKAAGEPGFEVGAGHYGDAQCKIPFLCWRVSVVRPCRHGHCRNRQHQCGWMNG